MSNIDIALWWSGVAAWVSCGSIGLLWIVEFITEWAINVVWSRKEFIAFVAERLRRQVPK
jgi:hypothetical protein